MSHNFLVDVKQAFLSFIILNVIGFATDQQTVLLTKYSDATCKPKGATPTDQGVVNPLSIPVNSCVLWNNVVGNFYLQYIKFAPCKPSSEGTGYLIFVDKATCEAATASQLTGQTVMDSCVQISCLRLLLVPPSTYALRHQLFRFRSCLLSLICSHSASDSERRQVKRLRVYVFTQSSPVKLWGKARCQE